MGETGYEHISLHEAGLRGMLKTGMRITTNGNGNTTDEYYSGIIIKSQTKIHIKRDDGDMGTGYQDSWQVNKSNTIALVRITKTKKVEVAKMLKGVAGDVKGFVQENRYVLYWISLILLADHFILGGQCKEKLLGTFNALIDKVNSVIKKNTES